MTKAPHFTFFFEGYLSDRYTRSETKEYETKNDFVTSKDGMDAKF